VPANSGPTFLTLLAAIGTGGVFIFSTFYLWWWAVASGVFGLVFVLVWLWTGTSTIPEKADKDVGFGVRLPLYTSGPASVGWWAMFITMLGDMAAFVSLIFGYFFYWTSRPDFLAAATGPGTTWPAAALALGLVSWAATMFARRANRRDAAGHVHAALLVGALAACGAAAALVKAPLSTGMNPTRHVYPATVWVLVIWTALHLAAGVIMQLYCVARRAAGRLTAAHHIDVSDVGLYWHFAAATLAVTVAVIAGFPMLS
jgi:cytochrome c oxidase subunit I+III